LSLFGIGTGRVRIDARRWGRIDYSHAEIGEIVGQSQEASRQSLRRAKQAVKRRRPRFDPQPLAARRLTEEFARAMTTGDVATLMNLLHEEIVADSDGGGRARAAMNPIFGRDRVARFLAGIAQKSGHGLNRQLVEINAQPGVLGFRNGEAQTALVLDIEQDQIRTVYTVVNPEKLQHLPKDIQRGHAADDVFEEVRKHFGMRS
jgi:RNA polymerase sigma-70 factor, ECF subfamily